MTIFLPLFTSLLKYDLIEEDFLTALKKKKSISHLSISLPTLLYFSSYYLALLGIMCMCLFIVDLLLLEYMFDKSTLFTVLSVTKNILCLWMKSSYP